MDESSKICGFLSSDLLWKMNSLFQSPLPLECRDFSSEACKKNLEENNAAVRIRHCAARSVIFPRSCGISLFCQVPAVCGCAPKLKSTILSDRRIVFTLRRGGDWDFSSQFQRSALSFHFYLKPCSIFFLKAWSWTPVSFFGLARLHQQVLARETD